MSRRNTVPPAPASRRMLAAVLAAKIASAGTRALGRGGGTALPGLIATRVEPNLVRDLASQLEAGSAIVSGTNGKTTTSRMLAAVLQSSGFNVVRNSTGSNLTRGVASALLGRVNFRGKIGGTAPTFGLFEVDEAALPEVVDSVSPTSLVLLNLFRDQLDRYGEVATVARLWSRALTQLRDSARLISNADDPLVANVADGFAGERVYFGIEGLESGQAESEHAGDVKSCPRCGSPIQYSLFTLGHLGHYACAKCGFSRPTPAIWAMDVETLGIGGSIFVLRTSAAEATVDLPLPGLYNVYNALAAAAAALSLGVELTDVVDALAHVTPAFGRMECIEIGGKRVYMALAKNPTGMNEVLRTVTSEGTDAHLMMMLNDNTADGHDVSWIWDAEMELLAGQIEHAVFSGTRAADMALRFKYAGLAAAEGTTWDVEPDTQQALLKALAAVPPGGVLFVIPTYTAMLDVRSVLSRLGHVRPYWEE
ncbi:MAG TPA: Mur ligase family protein [Chloroflexota bacterium]